jgi:hypothetical protein
MATEAPPALVAVLEVVPMKVTIRAFVYGQRAPLFTETLETVSFEDLEIETIARRHALEYDLENRPHAIEIEFPPMGLTPASFFRIGTDPRLMKIPIPLSTLNDDGVAEILKRQFKAARSHLN